MKYGTWMNIPKLYEVYMYVMHKIYRYNEPKVYAA